MSSLPNPAPQHVALYARVSTEDQADRGTVQGQRDFLRSFTQLYGMEVAGEYVDDGFSGTLPLDRRPDGRRLLEDAEAGKFAVVLVYRLDRLGRSLVALLDAHDRLERAGVTIRSTTEPFDTSTPIGRFLFQLLASLAELEKSTIAERMTLGRNRVARAGKWVGGPVPFGDDTDADGRLIPSARPVDGLGLTEAEVARSVFERVAEGATATAEARRLNALGVPSVQRYAGGKELRISAGWTVQRVCDMIHNSVYKGVHTLKSRLGPVEREVPALVSPELWEAANRQLTRSRDLAKKNARHRYLLRGLITCEGCGRAYCGVPVRSGTGRGRPVTFYYRCNGQGADRLHRLKEACGARYIPADWLEAGVWNDCREFISDPGEALAEARSQLCERLSQSAALEEERHRLQHRLVETEAERERVMTLFRRGRATLAEAEAQLDAVNVEAAELRTRLDAMRAQDDLAQAFEASLAEATALLARLRERLEEIERTNDWEKKRQVVELLVAGISIRTEGGGREKRAGVTLRYVFGRPRAVVVSATNGRARGRECRYGEETSYDCDLRYVLAFIGRCSTGPRPSRHASP
jgi:site-specific DNA recombinase